MQEDVKILEQFINLSFLYGKLAFTKTQLYEYQKAVCNLLNRNKELEKIEQEHQKINGELRERVKELEEKLEEKDMQHELELISKEEYTKQSMGEIIEHYYTANEDCIPKSKIKEKIEEIDITIKEVEGNIENSTDEERRYWKKERHDLFMQKYILQELLEE